MEMGMCKKKNQKKKPKKQKNSGQSSLMDGKNFPHQEPAIASHMERQIYSGFGEMDI